MFNLLPEELIKKMKSTPQSPLHHAEGSIYDHSVLVAQACPGNIDYQIAAIFHDMGKIDTTKFREHNNGGIKISSVGHEDLAKYYISRYLSYFKDYNINWDKVIAMCEQHMRAHLYLNGKMSNPNKRKAFESLPYFEYIITFAKADNEGRKSEGGLPIVVITVGIPGSGKTTWRKEFCIKSDYRYVNPDELREKITGSISDQTRNYEVWQEAYKQLTNYINNKQNVVFDSTACSIKTVNEILKVVRYKAIICFKIFDCDVETGKARIADDIVKGVNRSNVPDYVINKMNENFYLVIDYLKANNFNIIKE